MADISIWKLFTMGQDLVLRDEGSSNVSVELGHFLRIVRSSKY